MKIRIASDLHLETRTFKKYIAPKSRDYNSYSILPEMENDNESILVLAGDIVNSYDIARYTPFFEEVSKRFKSIVIISGNHEFYHNEYFKSLKILKDFYSQYENVYFLSEGTDIRVSENIEIFGTTLWSNFYNEDPICMNASREAMNDYRLIAHGDYNFSPEISLELHKKEFDKLEKFVYNDSKLKKIIVTHHAPASQSIANRFKDSIVTGSFVNLYDNFIEDSNIELWIHGHTHSLFDYTLGKTRVIGNPLGYIGENTNFSGNLLVEI